MDNLVSRRSALARRRGANHILLVGIAAIVAGLLFALVAAPGDATADSGLAAGVTEHDAAVERQAISEKGVDAAAAKSLRIATRSVDSDYLESLPENAQELLPGMTEEVSLSENNDYVQWFIFVPETSGAYLFASSKDSDEGDYYGDPYGALYTVCDDGYNALELVNSNDDADGNNNFQIVTAELQAGSMYYLACSSYGNEEAFYAVSATAFDANDISVMGISYEYEVLDSAESLIDALNIRIESFETDENDDPVYLEYLTDYEIEGWYVGEYDEYGEYAYSVCDEPTQPGDYRLVLKGVEPYSGAVNVDFTILDSKDLSNYEIRINEAVPYDGMAVTLEKLDPHFFSVRYDGYEEWYEEIELSSDNYAITSWMNDGYDDIEEAVEIGGYYATISGVDPYSGSVEVWFNIVSPKNLSAATVSVTPDTMYYTGGEIGYSVEVCAVDGTPLEEGKHYTVSLQRFSEYSDEFEDVDAVDSEGYYQVVIEATGTDGYEGTAYGEFEILENTFSIHDAYALLPNGEVPALTVEASQAVSLDDDGDIRWLSFTPDEDGDYVFRSGGDSSDPRASLFGPIFEDDDEYGNYDLANIGFDDDSADDMNFMIKAPGLSAGVTYYLACGSWDGADSYLVTVRKYDPNDLGLCYAWVGSSVWVGTPVSLDALDLTVEAEKGEYERVELTRGTDYEFDSWVSSNGTVLTAAPTTAGDYFARLKGLDPYTGTLDVPFRIKDPYDLESSWWLETDYVYADGSAINGNKLGLSLEFEGSGYTGTTLKPEFGKNYKVVAWYDDEGDAIAAPSMPGWYEVEIEGVRPYYGKISADFKLRDPKNIADYDYDAKGVLWDNGSAMTYDRLGVKLYPYGKPSNPITYNKDFKLAGWYDDFGDFVGNNPASGPVGAGYYEAELEGAGTFTGTRWFDFEVLDPHDIGNYNHPWTVNVAYDGNPMTPEKLGFDLTATAENGSAMTLKYGKAFELKEWAAGSPEYDDDENWLEDETMGGEELSDIVDKGYYSLILQGVNPYYGTTYLSLRVVDANDLAYATITGLPDGGVYHNNFSINPVVYAVNGQRLNAGTDYTLTLQRYVVGKGYQTVDKVTEPGSYRVLVEGKGSLFGGYQGETEQYFVILADSAGKYNIANATISGLSAQTYTGRALTPAPVVKLAGGKLTVNSDYKVSYANNTNAGTATVTVTGAGFYKGSKSTTFKINKANGSIAIKAKSKKALAAKSGKKTTIKASKAFKVTQNLSKGKVTYKKVKGDKKITVAKNGKITVKKGLKKGKTYTIKVKATSAATANYNAATSKVISVKIKVK